MKRSLSSIKRTSITLVKYVMVRERCLNVGMDTKSAVPVDAMEEPKRRIVCTMKIAIRTYIAIRAHLLASMLSKPIRNAQAMSSVIWEKFVFSRVVRPLLERVKSTFLCLRALLSTLKLEMTCLHVLMGTR